MLDKVKAIKTTVLGILTLVLSALTLFGVFTPEQVGDLQTGGISLVEALSAVIIAASGIVNIFRAD